MKVGEHIVYNGKEYIIVFKYTSGYFELREKQSVYNYELVHFLELEKIPS